MTKPLQLPSCHPPFPKKKGRHTYPQKKVGRGYNYDQPRNDKKMACKHFIETHFRKGDEIAADDLLAITGDLTEASSILEELDQEGFFEVREE